MSRWRDAAAAVAKGAEEGEEASFPPRICRSNTPSTPDEVAFDEDILEVKMLSMLKVDIVPFSRKICMKCESQSLAVIIQRAFLC